MSSKRKRVLVCGATGFIGRNIAEHLAQRPDLEVYGTHFTRQPLSHPGLKMIQADLRNPTDVNRALDGMDVVIQAAATTSGARDIVNTPHLHVTDNAVMNSLVFRAAHDKGIGRVVFFSCSVMYNSSDQPVRETAVDPMNIHPKYFGVAWTKMYVEKMAEFYSRLGATKHTVIRHSNIYGPYDKFDLERSHVFGATVAKVMTARDGKVTVWGDGSEERDLLYVSDLVDYVESALDRQEAPFALHNVGAGESISIAALVQKIIDHSGRKLEIEYDTSKPSIKTRVCLDTSLARQALGWQPQVSLDEGIRRTLEWYCANLR